MAYFSATGDIFPLEAITEALSIEPTRNYKKGDVVARMIIRILYSPKPYIEKRRIGL